MQDPRALVEAILRESPIGIDDPVSEASVILESAKTEGGGTDAERARALAAERASGRPLAHVVGLAHFFGMTFEVAPGVLAPRTETELLANTSIETLTSCGTDVRVVDMCCGSGNLGCAIAARIPGARVWASDLSSEAVALTKRNAMRLGLAGRVTVLQGDLFEPIAEAGIEGTVDLVVCNPPYISTGRLAKDRAVLLQYEPREAFDGGPYGLNIFQRVISDAAKWLRSGRWLAFEVGAGQDKHVSLLFKRSLSYEEPVVRCDDKLVPRVVVARKK